MGVRRHILERRFATGTGMELLLQSIESFYSSSWCLLALDLAGHPKVAPVIDLDSGLINNKFPTSLAHQFVYRTHRDDQHQVLQSFKTDGNHEGGNSDDGDGPAKRTRR